ncbi:MAG: hypothetical protein E6I27_00450 [Chloroflexi bacterium]|nr:MAG: hypothetical protein E6I27_00450 [Chloroflexota bacterium]
MTSSHRWIAALVALILGIGSIVLAMMTIRTHAPVAASASRTRSPIMAGPSAPHPTAPPLNYTLPSAKQTVYVDYYLWWTTQHWHDKLGPRYQYASAPVPGSTDAQGCNPTVAYPGAQIVDVPAEGLYDQTRTATFARHIDLAARAGLKGFLADWQGTGSATQSPQSSGYNFRFDLMVNEVDSYNSSHRTSFGLGVAYDSFGDYNRPAAQVIADFTYFYRRYGSNSAFRNVYSSKPIVMWLDSRKYTMQTIEAVSRAVEPYVYLLGDETAASWTKDRRLFDGTSYYWSTQDPWNNSHAASAVAQLASEVRADGKRWFAPFIVGFDKQLLGGVCVQRRGTQTLAQLWRINGATHPDGWFGISWNEFVENTYLEPSKRFGSTYLDALSALIKAS